MSLIPQQFVVADEYAVDPAFSGTLLAGTLVGLKVVSSKTYITPAVGMSGTLVGAIGIAGDGIGTNSEVSGFGGELTINSFGGQQALQNRVSDGFNETLGSGKMTVYIGTGRFLTDQYVADPTTQGVAGPAWGATGAKPGDPLYADNTGKFTVYTSVPSGSRPVGYIAEVPKAYPSGVPGTDINGSTSLGTYLSVILSI